jgi:hypothetical protein
MGSLVGRVRAIEVAVHPLGGENFKARLGAAKPSVGGAKAEKVCVQGRRGAGDLRGSTGAAQRWWGELTGGGGGCSCEPAEGGRACCYYSEGVASLCAVDMTEQS